MFGSETILAAITSLFQSSLFANIPRANSILVKGMVKNYDQKNFGERERLLAAKDGVAGHDARLASSSSNTDQGRLVAHPLVQGQSLEDCGNY